VLQAKEGPGMGGADNWAVKSGVTVLIRSEQMDRHRILFDPGHGLEERLIREQFA